MLGTRHARERERERTAEYLAPSPGKRGSLVHRRMPRQEQQYTLLSLALTAWTQLPDVGHVRRKIRIDRVRRTPFPLLEPKNQRSQVRPISFLASVVGWIRVPHLLDAWPKVPGPLSQFLLFGLAGFAKRLEFPIDSPYRFWSKIAKSLFYEGFYFRCFIFPTVLYGSATRC